MVQSCALMALCKDDILLQAVTILILLRRLIRMLVLLYLHPALIAGETDQLLAIY
jgi:hypothetical protein